MLLGAGVKHGASDIHLRAGEPPLYRVKGQLVPLKFDRLTPEGTKAVCEHLIRDADARGRLDVLQEYDSSYELPGVARFRVNIHRQRGALSLVLRIIPADLPTVEKLGLPPVITTISEYERGLVLVTGATGSGKSSTLAAMIRHVNQTRRAHILTIEDPVEFMHTPELASITQREVGGDTKDFKTALRAALRMDPDVILVGEIRDAESVDIALKASETGHMVFSTVHTTDATKTLGRLMAMFPPEEQHVVRTRLADNLRATISQRLLARADGKGRVAALEVMVATGTVQDYLRDPSKSAGLKDILEKGRQHYGMQSFDQHLRDLYQAGTITMETALAAASNPADFQRALTFG